MSKFGAVFGDGKLEVRAIEGRGCGLVTTVLIKRHSRITHFSGREISKGAAELLRKRDDHFHVLTVATGHRYIDGRRPDTLRPGDGMASISNDANYTAGAYLTPDRNNAGSRMVFDPKTGADVLVLVAKRDIEPGEEITWSYMNIGTQAGAIAATQAAKRARSDVDADTCADAAAKYARPHADVQE